MPPALPEDADRTSTFLHRTTTSRDSLTSHLHHFLWQVSFVRAVLRDQLCRAKVPVPRDFSELFPFEIRLS